MKRIAGTFVLLITLGGCMQTSQEKPAKGPFAQPARPPQAKKSSTSPYQGPYGEPIVPGNLPRQGMSPGLAQVGFVAGSAPKAGTDLTQAGYLDTDGDNLPPGRGLGAKPGKLKQVSAHDKEPPMPYYNKKGGIVPVPAQGVPGAVSAIGALPLQMPRQPTNMRTSINFASPDGMRVTWYGPNGWNDQTLITPARYNFLQGGVYRMRLSSIVNRLEKVYYPTLEVVPGQETTATFLAHSSVPVTFTDEDFEQVDSGNFLVKVVYLPNPNNQDLATVAGPNELVSTRLEPGIDPIVEAQRRGTLLAIIRLGNIDLNVPNSPAMDAPNPYLMQRMMPPGMAPLGPPVMPPEKPEFKPIPIPLPKPAPPVENKKPTTLPILDGKGDKGIPEVKPSPNARNERVKPTTIPDSKPTMSDGDADGATDGQTPAATPVKRPGRSILP